jgi:hypothetical protein
VVSNRHIGQAMLLLPRRVMTLFILLLSNFSDGFGLLEPLAR